MTRTDQVLIATNGLLALCAFVASASTDLDALMASSLLTMAVAAVNIVVLVRRRDRAPAPRRRRSEPVDEMDAATVLDLDARLEALERAQHADNDRLRALANAGAVSGPAAGLDDVADAPTARRERA